MGFYISPGIYTREKDLSELIPNIATSTAALVGFSVKGDADNIRLITNTQQFISEYGEPNAVNGFFHHTALVFLEQGQRLYCKRVMQNALYGGVNIIKEGGAGSSAGLSVGVASPVVQLDSDNDVLFSVFGKDPGIWNNKLAVTVDSIVAASYTFVIHVWQLDADNVYVEQEAWTVSRKTQVDGYGKQQYLETAINGYSQYIVVADNVLEADTVLPEEETTDVVFLGGVVGTAWASVPDSAYVTGWAAFTNPDDVDVRMLLNGGQAGVTVQGAMKTIVEARKDCIAIFDVPYATTASVASMLVFRSTTQNYNSSYCALYTPWVNWYDPYNDVLVDIPPSGFVGAQMAYSDFVSEPWFAPAGMNRGRVNGLGLTNIFTQGERDSLYEAQVNPLQLWKGQGIAIWGQKTEQTKASALDRVNVRRLLIVLEKVISAQLRYFVFEPNNELTRFRVTAMIEEYCDLLSSRGAFQTEAGDKGYRVLCDTTNNTPAIIDRNELHVDIFIKPTRAAEYIQLQAIITATGASFDELIARGVQF